MFHISVVLAIFGSALGEECQTKADKGASYRGLASRTKSGRICQAWDKQTPHKHDQLADNLTSNFCRNPDNEEGGVWCYTKDDGKRWEYCDVPIKDSCPDGKCEDKLCERLRKEHHLVAMARVGYYCLNSPGHGEGTDCDKELLSGMEKCTDLDDCLISLISRSTSCNSTAVTCASLARLYDFSSSARYGLCEKSLRKAGVSCSPWDNVQKTQEIMSAGVTCIAKYGPSKNASNCVAMIMGEDDGCICEVLDQLIPSCKRNPGTILQNLRQIDAASNSFVNDRVPDSVALTSTNVPSSTCLCGDDGLPEDRTDKIIGGMIATIPWQVGVYSTDSQGRQYLCGGTILSPTFILTAAHCTEHATMLDVHLGSNDRESQYMRTVAQVIEHPDYVNHNTLWVEFDFSILRLNTAVDFNFLWDGQFVRPACLPSPDIDLTGLVGTVSGWGQTTENGGISTMLLKVNLDIIDKSTCEEMYSSAPSSAGYEIQDNMLCTFTEGRDSCRGDSGGPSTVQDMTTAALRHTLVGVVSFGERCAEEFPGVFARVPAVLDWIVANTQGVFDSSCNALN